MGIILIDGFDQYTVPGDVATVWLNGGSVESLVPGRFSGSKAVNLQAGQAILVNVPGGNTSTLTSGVAWNNNNTTPNVGSTLLSFFDGSTCQISINYNTSGYIFVNSGNITGATLIVIDGLPVSGFFHVEASLTFDTVTGSIQIQTTVNGQTQPPTIMTGINTAPSGNSYANVFQLGPINGTPGGFIDDLYLSNATSFEGDCQVQTVYAQTDGFYNGWSLNGETSTTACINTQAPASSQNFIQSSTIGDVSTCSFTLPDIQGPVIALAVGIESKLDAAGSRTISAEYRSNSDTLYDGTPFSVPGTAYKGIDTVYSIDPETSDVWSVTSLTGAQWGVKDQS